jgi:hypothetical protein
MWAIVYVVGLLEVGENDFVFNLIGIYGEWKTELEDVGYETIKMSNGYPNTEHPTFWSLISPAIPVTWNMQLYIRPNI